MSGEQPKPDIQAPGGRTTALLSQIPPHLKDPKNFAKIYTAIANAGRTKHSHGEITEWATCFVCQRRANDRLLMMKSLGFTSKAMYLTWLKIHSQLNSMIQDKDKLAKYNSY